MNFYRKVLAKCAPKWLKNIYFIRLKKCGKVTIAYSRFEERMISDWYIYCVKLIAAQAVESNIEFNIIIGDFYYIFNNNYKTFRIALQIEHTLVKKGGRDSDDAIEGQVPINSSNEFYLVRLAELSKLKSADIIIDYSRANLINVKKSNFNSMLGYKYFYVVPLLYSNTNRNKIFRRLECVSMFGNPNDGRRKSFLDASRKHLAVININGIYNGISKIYRSAKIIFNIHQTEHHCTAEELRIVPAAINGVIVLSETSPLLSSTYTKDFAIWDSLEGLPLRAVDVLKNYDNIYHHHFGGKFERRLSRLAIYNNLVAKKIISSLSLRV